MLRCTRCGLPQCTKIFAVYRGSWSSTGQDHLIPPLYLVRQRAHRPYEYIPILHVTKHTLTVHAMGGLVSFSRQEIVSTHHILAFGNLTFATWVSSLIAIPYTLDANPLCASLEAIAKCYLRMVFPTLKLEIIDPGDYM